MISHNEIIKAIKNGVQSTCDQAYRFTDSYNNIVNAEYLFTVNIAQSLLRMYGPLMDEHKIFLERHAQKVYRDCIPAIKTYRDSKNFPRLKKRSNVPKFQSSGSTKRIDLTVYNDRLGGYGGPLLAIEVKGFNASKKNVIRDFKRLEKFLTVKGNTGSSVMELAVFTGIKSYRVYSDKTAELRRESLKKIYERYIKEAFSSITTIDTEVKTYIVSEELHGVLHDDEFDGKIIDSSQKHLFIGVLVILKRK